jgi:hypothetical protein
LATRRTEPVSVVSAPGIRRLDVLRRIEYERHPTACTRWLGSLLILSLLNKVIFTADLSMIWGTAS